MPDDVEQPVGRECVITELDDLMRRAAMVRHRERRRRLVVAAIREAYVERGGPLAGRASVRRDDERRIDASGQQRGDGHIRHRLTLHRGQQALGELRQCLVELPRSLRVRFDGIVGPRVPPLGRVREDGPGRQCANVGEPRRRLGDVAES